MCYTELNKNMYHNTLSFFIMNPLISLNFTEM